MPTIHILTIYKLKITPKSIVASIKFKYVTGLANYQPTITIKPYDNQASASTNVGYQATTIYKPTIRNQPLFPNHQIHNTKRFTG